MSENVLEKLYSQKAEAVVLSSIIYNPDFLRTETNLEPRHFYSRVNQCIFWALQELIIKNSVDNIDALNLETVLFSNAGVKKVMGEYNLTNLQKYIEDAKYASKDTYEEYKLYENTVLSLSLKRDLYTFSIRLGKECQNPDMSLDDLNDFCNNGITSIINKYVFGGDSVLLGEELDEVWSNIVSKRNANGSYGIPFIVERLNEYVTLVPGEMTIMMGKTGKGKSSFFLAQGLYAAITLGVPTLIIDSELTTEVWLPRAIANLSGVTVNKVKTGNCTPDELNRIEQAKETLRKAPIVHQFEPTFDKLKIEQLCRKWKNKIGCGLIIYDYIKPTSRYNAAEISQSLGLMADFLKGISGNLQIPVLAGLQQNKLTGEAADSQKPERYCDCMLYWEEKTEEMLRKDTMECGNFCIKVGKNRNGRSTFDGDYIDVKFQMDLMRISGARRHEEAPF